MALTDKLRNLDQRVLPGTRGPDEDAETYLRRVASSRAISPAQSGDVMVALREYLGVEAGGVEAGGAGADDADDQAEGDESAEGGEDQQDAAEEKDSDGDDKDDKDEKEDEDGS